MIIIKKLKIVLLFILSILLTACQLPWGQDNGIVGENDWKKEVLWAQECGLEKMPCCADRDPVCSYGLACCTDPNDPERRLCVDDCSCGEEGEFCCPGGSPCLAGLACASGNCVPCGRENEPCCPGESSCPGELLCYKNQCLTCGEPGHPCCPGEFPCAGENKTDRTRTECRDGACVFCGSDNQVACQNGPACLSGHVAAAGWCYLCGNYNQPCCNASSSTGYECDPENGLDCQLGFCAR